MDRRRHRRSIRLQGYDYTRAGAYFITVCTQNRAGLFGDVDNGEMRLNDAGRMVQSIWDDIPAFYPGVDIDEFVVMPNHIHGIVLLAGAMDELATTMDVGAPPRGRPDGERGRMDELATTMDVGAPPRGRPDGGPDGGRGQKQGQARGQKHGQARGPAPTGSALSLADVVHRFKTLTTKRYIDGVKQSNWTPFAGRVWQRNYYEHIIRNEESLNRIRRYITENPALWEMDSENPSCFGANTEDKGND